MPRVRKPSRRRGNVLVMSAVLMSAVLIVLTCAIDVGYLMLAKDELQRTADAASIAAAWELVGDATMQLSIPDLEANARADAARFAAFNPVREEAPELSADDVAIGFIANPRDPASPFLTNSSSMPNATRVRVRRTSEQNGAITFLLARFFGNERASVQAEATAAVLTQFAGFSVPSDGSNVQILPFALDNDTWIDLEAGVGTDDWTWNDTDQTVESGPDGILEFNLYPQGIGSPGNRGTVDIGSDNNSTADIARQILDGISPSDFAYHGGELKLNQNGELPLSGDTGISAGVKDELAAIIGMPRIIPVFSQVIGPGNNATYTVVEFIGGRILEVKLTGSTKRVIVQPASVTVKGGIPSSNPGMTTNIHSPVWLVR